MEVGTFFHLDAVCNQYDGGNGAPCPYLAVLQQWRFPILPQMLWPLREWAALQGTAAVGECGRRLIGTTGRALPRGDEIAIIRHVRGDRL